MFTEGIEGRHFESNYQFPVCTSFFLDVNLMKGSLIIIKFVRIFAFNGDFFIKVVRD